MISTTGNEAMLASAALSWWNEGVGNQLGAWVGASVGVIGAVYGSSAGFLASKGYARAFVLGAHLAMILVGVLLLITAIVAWIVGQPFHVWYPLGLPGLILSVVLGVLYPAMRSRYGEAEQRKLAAAELRRA